MLKQSSGLFGSLKITNWYRFVLYFGAVLFILSSFSQPVAELNIRQLAGISIVISLVMWFIEGCFEWWADWKEKTRDWKHASNSKKEKISADYLTLLAACHFVMLFFWLVLFVLSF